ncbi:glycerate kinase [Ideonella sp.]|uniref:glycerate kinase type-2 family protein n=1 Tax=Ideonella sp. TaxID=1929293 RepID=UPI0035B3178F
MPRPPGPAPSSAPPSAPSPCADPLALLHRLYAAMREAADPARILPPHLPEPPERGRTVVVGVGKSAAAMAQAVEAHWPADARLSGVVVVPEGSALPLARLRLLQASHPVPDARSEAAGRALLAAVQGLGPDDLVLALVSGGGSALCALPAEGLALADKQRLTRELLARGATIGEINTVRRHLSAIKGGRLALAAHPARVHSLILSDVPGDDPAVVASGPTLPDSSTCADAAAVLARYAIEPGPTVAAAWADARWESPKPGDARLAGHTHRLVASAWNGLQAAAQAAQAAGWRAHILAEAMEGEARDQALAHAAIARAVAERGVPFAPPCVLLSGGEPTVTLQGPAGRGGRNTEFALALALALGGHPRIHALAAGTDGLDGAARAAGAWVAPDTLARAHALGLSLPAALAAHDSATALDALGQLVHTGPTHTNINDFRALVILDT